MPYSFTRKADGNVRTATDINELQAAIEDLDANGTEFSGYSGTPGNLLVLDLRTYITAAGGASGTGKTTTVRRANAAALRNALNDCHNEVGGAKIVYVPGGSTIIYELDLGVETNNTITINSGMAMASFRQSQDGPQFHLYGTTTYTLFTGTNGMSRCLFEGLRFEDKRTPPADATAAASYGDCFSLTNAHDGLMWRWLLIKGFRRQINLASSDVISVEHCWLSDPWETSFYATSCLNNITLRKLEYDLNGNGLGPMALQSFYISGGGVDSTLSIEDVKGEGGIATANAVVLNGGIASTKIKNLGFRGGAAIESVIRFQGALGDGICDAVTLENIGVSAGKATNLLKIVTTDGSPETYTILAHASQASAIYRWDRNRRVLSNNIETTNALSFTSSGTAAGTVVYATGAGTGPTATITGTDERGVIELTTGTTPAASNQIFAMYFRVAWPRTPKCVSVSPANANAAALSGNAQVYPGAASDSRLDRKFWRLYVGSTALTAATLYKWHYKVNP